MAQRATNPTPTNNVYVGERYVPVVDGPWDSTKVYGALVMVTYNNATYISKIPVPAGTVPTDTNYWMLFPAANPDLTVLQAQVNQISTDLTTTKQDVTQAQNDIAELESKDPVPPAGKSWVHEGGTQGQVLTKASNANGVTSWQTLDTNPPAGSSFVPSGGSANQALLKNSGNNGDTKWATVLLPETGKVLVPAGGTTGQVLSKASNANGDLTWSDASEGSGFPAINSNTIIKFSPNAYMVYGFDVISQPSGTFLLPEGIRISNSGEILLFSPWVSAQPTNPTASNGPVIYLLSSSVFPSCYLTQNPSSIRVIVNYELKIPSGYTISSIHYFCIFKNPYF